MSFYYKAGRKSFNKKRSWYGSNSLAKRAKGQIQAAKSGTDNASFTIAVNHPFSLQSITPDKPMKDMGTKKVGNVYAINVYDVLAKSPNFQRFRNMFDQVKIDRIDFKLQVTNQVVSLGAPQKLYDIYVAIDRNGLDDKYIVASHTQAKDANDSATLDRYYLDVGGAIASIGSNFKSQLNAYQRWSSKKSIWPSTTQEKGQFVATDDVIQFDNYYDNATAGYMLDSNFIVPQVVTTSSVDVSNAIMSIENKDTPAVALS